MGALRDVASQIALPGARAPFSHYVSGISPELADAGLADEHVVQAASILNHPAHLGIREAQARARPASLRWSTTMWTLL